MQISDQQQIKASREQVYEALNDPAVLKQAIPGCQELTKVSDTEMKATVGLKIGPIKATFKGEVQLSDLQPPSSYTITGKGSGGASGHASGTARVKLEEKDGGTLLSYEVEAKIGGKIAQLGGRLVQATAKRLAGQFFAALGKHFEGDAKDEQPAKPAESEQAMVDDDDGEPIPTWQWAVAGVLTAAVFAAIIYSNT